MQEQRPAEHQARSQRDACSLQAACRQPARPSARAQLAWVRVAPGGQPRRRAASLLVSPRGSLGCEGSAQWV